MSKALSKAPHSKGTRHRQLEAITAQTIVNGNETIAKALLARAAIRSYATGEVLMEQGGEDSDVALILGGSVVIQVNGHTIATRASGIHVGEMALLEPFAKRSATVRAAESTVVARIEEHAFTVIANKNAILWRRLALCLADRLRQRSRFHVPPREQPAVFIGSSTEGVDLAQHISSRFRRLRTVPKCWTNGVFEASKTTIESLVAISGECDFAILVLTADDVTVSRSKAKPSPRDNVIFELGLFMGALGRERTIVVAPPGIELKIPSDLLGVTMVRYKARPRDPRKRLQEPIRELIKHIRRLGPRRVMEGT